MGPTGKSRIVQIHPTRRCNLRCLHCYSSSGPEVKGQLDAGLLTAALSDAAVEGYTVASFSGGEPLMYDSLYAVLDHAHMEGMLTTVTSNGMLLDERRLGLLKGRADLLAISLDGVPESHNRFRQSEHAFQTMESRLDGLRQAGIPFGFIFTLTRTNINELQWVAQFAAAQGARLLQIHPLEEVGRAEEQLPGARPDSVAAIFALLESFRIQAMSSGSMHVQVDLFDRDVLRANPSLVFAGDCLSGVENPRLSDMVSPLIIEADGTMTPLQYGFARQYSLGNLHRTPLKEAAIHWRENRLADFQELCRRVHKQAVREESSLPFFNWYETIFQQALREQAAPSFAEVAVGQ